MKSYKFRFSKLVLVLIGLAIAAALAAVAYTVYRICLYGFSSPLLVIQHVAVLIVAALAIVIFVSLLIRSVYKITDTQIILWFGIVKQTFKIADIESVHLFTRRQIYRYRRQTGVVQRIYERDPCAKRQNPL